MPSGNLCYIPRHHNALSDGIQRAVAAADLELAATVSIYCDASMMRTDGDKVSDLGAWAFLIPSVPIDNSGVERGMKNTHLELLAAIRGCECAIRLGHSRDVLNICSDCNYTESWVKELQQRGRNGSRGRLHYGPDGKLVVQLSSVMEGRKVKFTRVTSSISEQHRKCHNLARKVLRENLPPEEQKRIVSAVRVDEVRKNRAKLIEKLAGIDAWLAEYADLL